jgi:hypothetical protein
MAFLVSDELNEISVPHKYRYGFEIFMYIDQLNIFI